jgi:hypothetical protein
LPQSGVVTKCVFFKLGPVLSILPCKKIKISIERSQKRNIEKNHCVFIKMKQEKDVDCRKYCYFGKIFSYCHELGTLASLHS